MPKDRQEKNQFHELIKLIVGPTADDENVREAISNCYRVFSGTSINSDVTKYMSDSNADNITNLVISILELTFVVLQVLDFSGSLKEIRPNRKKFTCAGSSSRYEVRYGIIYQASETVRVVAYHFNYTSYREKAKVDLENFKSHLNSIIISILSAQID